MGQINKTAGKVLDSTVVTIPNGSITKQAMTIPIRGSVEEGTIHSIIVKTSADASVVTHAYVRVKRGGVSCSLLSFDVPVYAAGDATTIDSKGFAQLVQGLFAAEENAEIIFIPDSAPAAQYTLDVSVWRV